MSSLVFPALAGVQLDVSRPSEFSTAVLRASTGFEYRALWYSRPRTRWNLTFDFLRSDATNAEWQKLVGFYGRMMGQFDSFLFTAPDDASVTLMKFGLGDGATTAFQLQRSLVPAASWSSPVTFWPTIGDGFEPVNNTNSTPQIYKAGVLQVVTTDYTISSSGLVTFVSAPAAAASLTWSGSYYWRARFNTDVMETQRLVTSIWKGGVELIQVFG